MILTRWHRHDLAGRILYDEPEDWDVYRFPAIMTHDYKYRNEYDLRSPGEALWPEKYPIEFLEKRKRNGYEWDSMYQQIPRKKGGTIAGTR